MPTVALINGHAFAGALMLSMMHDYRIMNPHRGFLCLNEVELGVPLKPAMSTIFRQKVSPTTYRSLVLEGKRFKVSYNPHSSSRTNKLSLAHFSLILNLQALDALKDGIIDGVGQLEETLKFINELKLQTKADKGVYGELKREMWRESLHDLQNNGDLADQTLRYVLAKRKEDEAREKAVVAFEVKAKL